MQTEPWPEMVFCASLSWSVCALSLSGGMEKELLVKVGQLRAIKLKAVESSTKLDNRGSPMHTPGDVFPCGRRDVSARVEREVGASSYLLKPLRPPLQRDYLAKLESALHDDEALRERKDEVRRLAPLRRLRHHRTSQQPAGPPVAQGEEVATRKDHVGAAAFGLRPG